MNKAYLTIGSIIAALGIVFGAFGAHWLKQNISVVDLQNFETGIRYQMYHAFAIILLGIISPAFTGQLLRIAFHCFWVGILFFSGSLYMLATSSFSGLYLSWLGPVTPVGGLLFITGWVLIIITMITQFKDQ